VLTLRAAAFDDGRAAVGHLVRVDAVSMPAGVYLCLEPQRVPPRSFRPFVVCAIDRAQGVLIGGGGVGGEPCANGSSSPCATT